MRKLHLLLLPVMTLALNSCANNGINFISVGEAIDFAQENFDPHLGDGYNVEYVFKTNNSKIDDGVVYQKHYVDPTKQEGEYTIEKTYDLKLDLSGIEGILYFSRCMCFGSNTLLELHSTIESIVSEIGYIDNGFIKINNHLGYYISSDHFAAVSAVLGSLLSLFQDIFAPSSIIITLITALLDGFSADQATFVFDVEFTRFGFIDSLNAKLSVDQGWFEFPETPMSQWVLGDYVSVKKADINLSLNCSYSI